MEFTASPEDIFRAVDVARKIDANPVALAGKLLGLSSAEQRAGVPVWAWVAVALGTGVYVGVQYGPKIRDVLGR
jgi:hypothetical protein